MAPAAALDTDVAIETPEHIVFRHKVAGPSRRFLAYLLDLVICYTAFTVVAFFVVLASIGVSAATDSAESALAAGVGLLLVVLFAIQWVYFAVLEAWVGRTPGKAALGLRVVSTTGRPIGFRAAALRNVLRAADALPLTYTAGLLSLAGFASMATTKKFQRLGDLVAGTIVVVPERASVAAPLVLWPPAQPFELAQLPDDVRLDADERQAIELFLRRRARLGRGREMELASMIAGPLAERFGLRLPDPSRVLALLYDRAANAGRVDAPPSSRTPGSWR
ncbi:MAG TPA: RDD family protein [Polyangiaceae bacterium]|jgi:uncharacterized RDD family membrane protein YckC